MLTLRTSESVPIRIFHVDLLRQVKCNASPELDYNAADASNEHEDTEAGAQNDDGDGPVVLFFDGDSLNLHSHRLLPRDFIVIVHEAVVLSVVAPVDKHKFGDHR